MTQVTMEFTETDLFLCRNGLRIAKRANGRWISLEPGYHVYQNADEITIEYKASEAGSVS
jgi:hypothetical protein